MRTRKLHFYTKYDSLGASSRMRSLQFLESLSGDFSVTYSPLISNLALSLKYRGSSFFKIFYVIGVVKRVMVCFWHKISQCDDVVVIEKELFPWMPFEFERLFLPTNFIIDADDAIFHYYDQVPLLSKKHGHLASSASCIHVGNEYLAAFYEAFNKNVKIVRTSINVNQYMRRSHKTSEPTILWIGSPSTSRYIKEVVSALNELSERINFRMLLIGFSDALLESKFLFEYEIIEWSEDIERNLLARGDIGIMPLPDDPFERGKCGYKLVQYLASGLLPVASDVGINRLIINGSQSGVAVSDGDWCSSLEKAITLLPEYDASAGYQFVYEKFDVHVARDLLSASFKEINL